MALVAVAANVEQFSAADTLCGTLECWMQKVMSRDIYRRTQCVDTYWTAGSSLDVKLLTDPYVHELMVLLVAQYPSMNIKKTLLRDSIL